MLIRRSLLTFLITGFSLLSLSLIFLSRFIPLPFFPLAAPGRATSEQHSDISLDLGGSWADPNPGDDTLRKHRPGIERPYHDNSPSPIAASSDLLHRRLQSFLEAPALSHAETTSSNEKACPRNIADKQVNQDQLKGDRDKWLAISALDIRRQRQAIVRHLQLVKEGGEPIVGVGSGVGEGRGVVMTAGNKNTAQSTLVTLRLLRSHKSTLPVQIFSFPGEITDSNTVKEMHDLGASHHELTGLQKVPGAWKNFHLKAAAILNSTFAEVLYLDSDNVPLRDPAYLFDEAAYKEGGGAVFWPDYNKDHPDNAIWRVLGRTCSYNEWQVESGQMLIDKRGNDGLNLAALHIANYMQTNHDFWFSLAGGDKDTFRYAFWAIGALYATSPRWLSALGSESGSLGRIQESKFCGFVMLQYDIARNDRGQYLPLFLHGNLLKHRNSGPEVPGHKIFHTIKRASEDAANEPSLNRARMWVYEDGGMCVDLAVEAAGDNNVGAGREQRLVTERFDTAYGGMFSDFEDRWKRAGGKLGGF